MIREMARGLSELVFPSVCAACAIALDGNPDYFCTKCKSLLTQDPDTTCPRCSSTIGEHTDVKNGCPQCRNERFYFERSFRLGRYENRLRDIVLRMKQPLGDVLAECMGRLWAAHAVDRFREVEADVVVPVPLHWWRRIQRGYNQSEALSEAIARQLKVAHRPRWLKRTRSAAKQATLSGPERRKNLRGAFRASSRAELKEKSVLLVDDVLTTGATASEASKALLDGGARQVVVAVLAHR